MLLSYVYVPNVAIKENKSNIRIKEGKQSNVYDKEKTNYIVLSATIICVCSMRYNRKTNEYVRIVLWYVCMYHVLLSR